MAGALKVAVPVRDNTRLLRALVEGVVEALVVLLCDALCCTLTVPLLESKKLVVKAVLTVALALEDDVAKALRLPCDAVGNTLLVKVALPDALVLRVALLDALELLKRLPLKMPLNVSFREKVGLLLPDTLAQELALTTTLLLTPLVREALMLALPLALLRAEGETLLQALVLDVPLRLCGEPVLKLLLEAHKLASIVTLAREVIVAAPLAQAVALPDTVLQAEAVLGALGLALGEAMEGLAVLLAVALGLGSALALFAKLAEDDALTVPVALPNNEELEEALATIVSLLLSLPLEDGLAGAEPLRDDEAVAD